MLRFLLGLDGTEDAVAISVYFRAGWIVGLVLVAAALAISVYLYRRETTVSSGWRRFLATCQALSLLLLVVLLLQPVAAFQLAQTQRNSMVVLIDTSESMATQDSRKGPEELLEVAKLQQKVPFSQQPGGSALPSDSLTPVSRLALAQMALEHPQINLLARLSEKFDVRAFTFDDQLRPQRDEASPTADKQPVDGKPPAPVEWLRTLKADGKSSQVGSAIDDAVARNSGQSVAGVIVLSDFGWIKGKDPVGVARELKTRGIPVYPVVVGLPSPPDIQVRRVIAPDVVFEGDQVPLRVQIDSRGFKGRTADLSFTIDGDTQTAVTQQVELNGEVQFEQFMFKPQKKGGTLRLSFAVPPTEGEATPDNNQISHSVRILDEKIKVLYIEGMPRWEYRYLRWVLLRDPRLEVKFLMTQGDPELPNTSSQYLTPKDIKDAFKYDMIILGDVPASYFDAEQTRLIDELVRKRGGSLLMVAGPISAPSSYRDTPIGELLPVNIGSGQWQPIGDDLHPIVTPAGRASRSVSLGDTDEATDRIWSRVKPLHTLPPLVGAKPGATVLLSLPSESVEIRGYPLAAWQRVGSGKSMFVATEDLWRMRLEVGSRYHARFWGQTIQFLTLSRLLGQNKQIALETDRARYGSGEQVRLFANVLTESFEPVEQASYSVTVARAGEPDSAVTLELAPLPDTPGLYSGEYLAGAEGTYRLATQPQYAEISNTVEFGVVNLPLEKRETSARADVAQQIAGMFGAQAMTLTQLADLPASLKGQEPSTVVIKRERDLWDAPLLFILLVIVAGLEWYARRRHNLV